MVFRLGPVDLKEVIDFSITNTEQKCQSFEKIDLKLIFENRFNDI